MCFAPDKIQTVVVFRFPAASQAVKGGVMFGLITLPFQDYARVFGVDLEGEPRIDGDLKHVAH